MIISHSDLLIITFSFTMLLYYANMKQRNTVLGHHIATFTKHPENFSNNSNFCIEINQPKKKGCE